MSDAAAGGFILLFLMSAVSVLLMVAILVISIRLLITRNESRSSAEARPNASTQKQWADLWEQKHHFEREAATLATALAAQQQEMETRQSEARSALEAATTLKSQVENELHAQLWAHTEEFQAREQHLREQAENLAAENLALNKTVEGLRKELAAAQRGGSRADGEELENQLDKAARRLTAALAERDAALAALNDAKVTTTPSVPLAVSAKRKLPDAPGRASPTTAVVTRTSRVKTAKPAPVEPLKQWTAAEDTALLESYLRERTIAATAVALRVDQIQVARRLVTLLLGPKGEIDDPSVPNHGKTYSKADQTAIPEAWRDGRKLPMIARMFGRDQLGVGWRLLDDASEPVELTADMIPDIVEEAHR